jgi:RNA polymerase sigma-70 factor, ECF subfamily
VHAGAEPAEATDWDRILSLYDDLLTLNPSPIIRLNRAVAVSRVAGPAAALAALRPLHNELALAKYYLLPSVTGRIHAELGERAQATACYRQALELPCSEPERRFLWRRLAMLGS